MTSRIKMSNPKGLSKPAGTYSHVARAQAGELLFIAGQVAVDANGSRKFVDAAADVEYAHRM